MNEFQNRRIVVTGGAQGIGLAISTVLSELGAQVWIADVAEDRVGAAAAALRDLGADVVPHVLDVTRPDSWARLAQSIEADGDLHGFVNNAGVSLHLGWEETDFQQWQHTIDVNLTGVYLGIRHLSPLMEKADQPSIVNISSVAGMVGYFDPSYAASKWAVRGLTKSAAMVLAASGIRVNSIHPGPTATPMLEQSPELAGHVAEQLKSMPAARMGKPLEIAGAVQFLLSPQSAYVNATELVVDGGMTGTSPFYRVLREVSTHA